jgi:hypothetical protein
MASNLPQQRRQRLAQVEVLEDVQQLGVDIGEF